MARNRQFLFVMFLGGAALAASGCGPTYPKCENDEHCAEKGEFCVNGLCQQCRDNSHCEAQGPGFVCSGGKCARRPGYCDDSVPCPGNQKCRDNECGAECLNNDECGAGKRCENGSCVAKPECGEGADNPMCPPGQECQGGRCTVKIASVPNDPVYFDFDKANLRDDQRAKLDGVAAWTRNNPDVNIQLEGYCDERGTDEYNLALGERRAKTAQKYLTAKGVPAGKTSTISYGEERPAVQGSDESAWSKNRRVEFSTK